MPEPKRDLTLLLNAAAQGETHAWAELLASVYQELRRLAAAKMRAEAPGHTLQPTALVHEAWLRLGGGNPGQPFANRAHFFSAAAEAMRRILIESARRKRAVRHGAGLPRADIDGLEIVGAVQDDQLLEVHEVLEKLAAVDAQKAELVKLRYFVGLTIEDAAEILGISERTAKRHWVFARAWLHDELKRAAM